MNVRLGNNLSGSPMRSWQIGALFLPFVLVLLFTLESWAYRPEIRWLLTALCLLLLGLLVLVWIVGLIHFFPVWTLPAMGVLLFLVVAFFHVVSQLMVYSILEPLLGRMSGWTGYTSPARGLFLVLLSQFSLLVIVMALVMGLLRLVPGFHQQVRLEWTLLSFLLYGIAILPVVANDEYAGMGMYQTASLLVLITGMLIYLMASKRWQRALALVIAAVISPIVISMGLYQTFPMQPWADPMNVSFRIWEALQPVLYLAPLPILLILAAVAPQLPLSKGQELSPSS